VRHYASLSVAISTNPSQRGFHFHLGTTCTPTASPGLGKLSTRSRVLEEKSNCKLKSGALHGQVTPVESPRTFPPFPERKKRMSVFRRGLWWVMCKQTAHRTTERLFVT